MEVQITISADVKEVNEFITVFKSILGDRKCCAMHNTEYTETGKPVTDIFTNIRAECARRRWTIEELSDKLGVERKTFYNWEKKQDFPTSALVQMAQLFGITTDELLGISGIKAN